MGRACPALFKLHRLYFKQCVRTAKKMKTGGGGEERLAEELVKPLPIAEDAAATADGTRLRFLSPSRLSPWLSARWLARLCLPARLAARANTCLEETSSRE